MSPGTAGDGTLHAWTRHQNRGHWWCSQARTYLGNDRSTVNIKTCWFLQQSSFRTRSMRPGSTQIQHWPHASFMTPSNVTLLTLKALSNSESGCHWLCNFPKPFLAPVSAPSRWPTLTNLYLMPPKGHLDVILTTWAEWCHFVDSLSETFLWVMSYQPSSPKKLQHGGLGQTLQGAISFTRSCPGEPFRGPCPGCFSVESPEEEKAGLRKEAQLTSLTADWRRWVLRTVEDCRVFALFPESLDELLPGKEVRLLTASPLGVGSLSKWPGIRSCSNIFCLFCFKFIFNWKIIAYNVVFFLPYNMNQP